MFLQVSVTQPLLAERYRLVRSLGQGGMGRVWLARDEVLHRDVAINDVIPPEGLTAEERDEMRQRTLREARAAARLNHPSVVRVYDVVRTDVHPWIVMEYVPSRSLHEVIAEDGTLPPARVAQIGLQVLGALRAAHRAGVLHRDVKPSNVLLTDDGRVVLTDFGLATMPGEATVTRPGMVLGSPAYISPERAREGYAGPESDLWSLGATLYAGVEGNSPYQRSSAIATLSALVTEDPPPARHAGPLRAVLNGLLKKDPAARIDAAEAERLLRRAAGGGLASRLWLVPKPRPGAARSNPVADKPLPQGVPGAPDPDVAVSGDAKSGTPVAGDAGTSEHADATVVVKPAGSSPSRASADAGEASGDTPADSSDLTARLWQPADPPPTESRSGEAAGSRSGEATRSALGEATRARLGDATESWPGVAGSRSTGSSSNDEPASSPHGDADKPVAVDESAPDADSEPLAWRARAGALVGTVPRPWLLAAAVTVLIALIVAVAALPDSAGSRRNAQVPIGASPATAATSGAPAAPVVPTPAASNTPSVSPSPTEGSPGAQFPAGWQLYTDSTGFSLAAPVGWNVQREGTILYFREPSGGRVLGIDQTDRPNMNPVADWTNQRNHRVPAGDFPGYQEVGIRSVPYFVACADWEFTYDRGGGRTHAINRGFVTSDHQAYGIWWSTPDSSWSDNLQFFNLITGSFKPKP
jgi:serine/threonine protein kinase